MNDAAVQSTATSEDLERAYIRACELELRALKPGNVHVHAPGHSMDVEDFRRSAQASAPLLAEAGQTLGWRVHQAVAATRVACGCNTNLGIVLLAAPLLAAAANAQAGGLRAAVDKVLGDADVADSEWINRAIRLAAPAGLGEAPRHDVRKPATAPLRAVMAAASQRDSIAHQYRYSYAELFEFAVPRWHYLRARWQSDEWATTGLYLGLLARRADSHVARKQGLKRATDLAANAARWETLLLEANLPEQAFPALLAADRELKASAINPGTTADLTVASLLIVFIEELLSTRRRVAALDAAVSMK